MSRRMSDYRAPDVLATDSQKVGWFDDQFKQAQSFLQSQRAWSDLDRAHEFIAGPDMERLPDSYSRVDVNMGKRQIRENVATLANVRPLWGFQTDQKDMEAQVSYRNQMLRGWHQNTFFDRSLEDTLKHAGVEGTGYLRPYWDPNHYAPGRGEIVCASYGAGQVFPVQMGQDRNLQKCYAVIIHHQVPLSQAHAMYPTKQHLITSDRDAPTGLLKVWGRVQRWLSPALNVGGTGRGQATDTAIFPVADIYEVFIMDLSINETGHELAFGKPDTSWFYKVPYVGQEIPAGFNNSAGQMLYRKAQPEDCMKYPLRRKMVFSSKNCLEDDTQEDWHGKVPLVKFQLDSWPWEYLGFGMPRDYRPVQDSNRRILRAIDDKINAGLNPSLKYNEPTISRSTMEEFDMRQPGQHLGVDMAQGGDQVSPLLHPDFYRVDGAVYEHVQTMFSMADYLIGTPALKGLAGLRQLPSDQTVEKLQEAMGALVWDYSRSVEQGLSEFGELWKCMSYQRYDRQRTVQMTGKDGITPETLNWDPQLTIPSHMPNENPALPTQSNYYQRARYYMDKVYMQITPMTAHQVTQMSRKLFLERLREQNFPIDPWTIAEAADLPNFGAMPDGTNNMIERWTFWQQFLASLEAQKAKLVQQGLNDAAAQAGTEPGSAPTGPSAPEGRPPVGLKSPKLSSKSGGRTTIEQS